MSKTRTIFTIGHSTHTWEEFVEMLRSFDIKVLVDIRSLPGSRKFPHFNQDQLIEKLPDLGIEYVYLKGLGGRRKAKKDSPNTRWRNVSFQGYADHMESEEFKNDIKLLEEIGEKQTTAFMCSEAVWWRCHRSMVADYLKAKGWKVLHIMSSKKVQEHPYTSPARIENEEVFYSDK